MLYRPPRPSHRPRFPPPPRPSHDGYQVDFPVHPSRRGSIPFRPRLVRPPTNRAPMTRHLVHANPRALPPAPMHRPRNVQPAARLPIRHPRSGLRQPSQLPRGQFPAPRQPMQPFAARQPQPNSADFYRDAYYNEEEECDPYEIEMKTDFNDPYNLAGTGILVAS